MRWAEKAGLMAAGELGVQVGARGRQRLGAHGRTQPLGDLARHRR